MLEGNVGGDSVRWNIWTCKTCGAKHLMTEEDEGVTPFIIACRLTPDCHGMAESSFYPKMPFPDYLKIVGRWAKPNMTQFAKLSDAEKEHVAQGGLIPIWAE